MMTLDDARKELEKFVGLPMCQDCKWKLGSDITNNCGCMGDHVNHHKHRLAYNRATLLQEFVRTLEANKCSCELWDEATSPCSDGEMYAKAITHFSGGFLIGSVRGEVKYCPFCGGSVFHKLPK